SMMSVFTGSTLDEVLNSIEERVSDKKMTPDEKTDIKLDIGKIPEILLDNTDRNRTSPFAFTGNRFEFRATGSSTNCASPLIVINAAVADELRNFKIEVDTLIDNGVKKDEAVLQTIRKYITSSKKIRFEGNGYSTSWHDEALNVRGLEILRSVPDAFKSYLREELVGLFGRHSIMNEVELKARYEVKNETYVKKVQIESRVLADIAANHIIPTAITYQNILIKNVTGIKEIFPDIYKDMASMEIQTIKAISEYVKSIRENSYSMVEARKKCNNMQTIEQKAEGYSSLVHPYFSIIRESIDNLELIVDNKLWPLPKYRELLNIH
ncbi:MAG: glutamine synthetase type III, partial [Rikenellaceae bacterium]